MMLGGSPWWLFMKMSRPFTFERAGEPPIQVNATLRGVRPAELVNSEIQADALMIIDARPLLDAGINYLLKFDRFVSAIGQSYTVQGSREAFDGATLVFHKCFVRGAS